jgi:hypothetical protein
MPTPGSPAGSGSLPPGRAQPAAGRRKPRSPALGEQCGRESKGPAVPNRTIVLLAGGRPGIFPSEPLAERAAVLARRAAERSLIAHMRSEEAEGVARAVRFARGGEAWRPHDLRQEAEEVFGFAAGLA